MTSKEAIKKARERTGLPLNTNCAIITDGELKIIEKDLQVLRILKRLVGSDEYDHHFAIEDNGYCWIETSDYLDEKEIKLLKKWLGEEQE